MKHWKKVMKFLPIIGVSVLLAVVIYGLHLGIFNSPVLLQNFIHGFGKWGVIIFILLQIVQVIIPILPGGISSVAGMLMFGYGYGLLYSYIGLVIGEILGFLLIRHYGKRFAKLILSEKNFDKFEQMVSSNEGKNVKRMLILTMLIPFAPDDIVCLVAGMTTISLKDFLKIILLLKPWSIGVYSFIMVYLFEHSLM